MPFCITKGRVELNVNGKNCSHTWLKDRSPWIPGSSPFRRSKAFCHLAEVCIRSDSVAIREWYERGQEARGVMVVEESEVIASHGRVASRPRRACMGAYASLWLDTQPRRPSAWSLISVFLWPYKNILIET